MYVIVDRIEGDYIVVEMENGECVNVPQILFSNVKEGDVIKIEVDLRKTEERKQNIEKLIDALFED